MKIIDPLARPLESPALVTIPMRDGVMLSARLWLPVLAPGERVPAIVDCHPYRVTDSSAIGNSRVYPYYAAHGYGCLRVDLRGSGNSEGILRDEYLAQEQDDGVDVINWCATQEWCTGAVGWTGISWGGFAAVQVAARRPAALKAIITICSTDDRYADDVHYRGGSVLHPLDSVILGTRRDVGHVLIRSTRPRGSERLPGPVRDRVHRRPRGRRD